MKSLLSVAELRAAADPILVALARAGDRSAFTEMIHRRHHRVRKFMYHLCGHPDTGDDLAQQVFLTAWRRLYQLRAALAFDAWLKQIMVTTWLEHLRRNKLELNAEVDPETTPGRNETPTARLDLDRALAQLPDTMRLCLVLTYNDGMSHGEIAALTGIPLGTVKSHITRGNTRLRESLADYRPHDLPLEQQQ